MKTTTRIVTAFLLTFAIVGLGRSLLSDVSTDLQAKGSADAPLVLDVQSGKVPLKSIGAMSVGPNGWLAVADSKAQSIVLVETGDTGPAEVLQQRVDGIDRLIAARLDVTPDEIVIADLAVNPASGKIYLGVQRKTDNQPVVVVVDPDGSLRALNLQDARYVTVSLTGSDASAVRSITGVEFAGDGILAAGHTAEEFASKIYKIPFPIRHGEQGRVYSAETYHVAHGRWETKAPIRTFVPYEEDGKQYVVGAFSCTPIAKFPLDAVESGGKIRGQSVVELGSGNRPLDMFTYRRNGKAWLVTNTDRFHWEKKGGFGPSRLWGVRVDMEYLNASQINESAARRDIKTHEGPQGIQIMDALFGAVHVGKVNNEKFVALRENGNQLDLELAELPQ